jgi:hypothetical protein
MSDAYNPSYRRGRKTGLRRHGIVKPFSRAVFKIGDDEPIEAERGGFDVRDRAPLAAPGFGFVLGLGIAVHDVLVFRGAFDSNLVGLVVNFLRQRQ